MLNMEVQARPLPYYFSWVNRETMIMLGAVSHIPEKVANRHFPGTLTITVPKIAVSESISPPHATSRTSYLGGVLGQFWKGCGGGSSVCVGGGGLGYWGV